MSDLPRVLVFAGSARKESFNKRLLAPAARGVEASGLAATVIDLRDFPLPVYDGDLEAAEGLPDSASRLRALFAAHQGLVIACPEYNGSIAPLLKNTIDWATRSPEATPDLAGFAGRVAALLAASPGPLGGMRGLRVVRELLTNIGVTVVPNQITVRSAFEAFEPDGGFRDARQEGRIEALGRELGETVRKLHA